MVLSMSEHTRKDFETLGEAAGRLLAELDRRAKQTSGETPDKLQDSGEGPSWPDKAAGEGSAQGRSKALDLHQPVAVARLRGGCDGLETVGTYRVGGKTLVADNDSGPVFQAWEG